MFVLEIDFFKQKGKILTTRNDEFEKLRDRVNAHSKVDKYAVFMRKEEKIFSS